MSNKEKQGTQLPEKSPRKSKKKDSVKGAKLVTLQDLLNYTLKNSPALKSAEERVKGSEYAEEQSDKTFQLNPSFKGFIGRHEKPAPASGGLRYELLVNQPFEVGGQQSARRKIGKYKRKQSEDQLFALRMRILSRVKFLYYKELILRRKWRAMKEVKRFFDQILGVTKAKRDERQISDPKALLVIILYNSFMNDYDNVKEDLDNNLEELKAVIYYQGDREIDLKGTIKHKFISFSDEELNQIARKS
ncbi:MAG TPA: TolC family protein [Spirochaetes bacterium]|nr:TolC family protein [Spirochaetota bacterium]